MVLRGDSSMTCLLLNFSMNETIHIHIYIPCWWVGKCVYKPRLHLNDNFENHGGGGFDLVQKPESYDASVGVALTTAPRKPLLFGAYVLGR